MAEDIILDTAPEIDVARLRCFEILAPLSEMELRVLARCCEESTFSSGDILVRQGEVAKHVYFLEDGAVNIYRAKMGKMQKIALIEGPGIFGEMALLSSDRVRTATVRAASDVRVFAISFSNMLTVLRCMPVLREQLRQLLHTRGFRPDSSVPRGATVVAAHADSITSKIAALCH